METESDDALRVMFHDRAEPAYDVPPLISETRMVMATHSGMQQDYLGSAADDPAVTPDRACTLFRNITQGMLDSYREFGVMVDALCVAENPGEFMYYDSEGNSVVVTTGYIRATCQRMEESELISREVGGTATQVDRSILTASQRSDGYEEVTHAFQVARFPERYEGLYLPRDPTIQHEGFYYDDSEWARSIPMPEPGYRERDLIEIEVAAVVGPYTQKEVERAQSGTVMRR